MRSNDGLSPFKNFKDDIPAGLVVFLVALPLSLGIAMASGAPLFAGIIGGVIGGIVVGALSGSPLGVSGPAAGLAVIVLNAITELGSFEIFLMSVVISGILQLIIGFLKAGIIAYYFPSSVIHGMLAGIGILIFLKQIPHAVGYDVDPEGDDRFFQVDGENTFSELIKMFDFLNYGAIIVTVLSLAILILWDTKFFKKLSFTKLVPGPLVAVAVGIFFAKIFADSEILAIGPSHLVSIPVASNLNEFIGNLTFPDFSGLSNPQVYITAIIITVVASIETLLSVEAADKLDPYKRITPTNRELKAQGVGNILTGLIGGLPVTQVIVRSSVNQQTGGKTKLSTIVHGILMLLCVILIPTVLNSIPLATLAAILLLVGFKLAKPALFKKMYSQGKSQFGPFLITIVGIILTDLLTGIVLGMIVAISVILYNNYKIPFKLKKENLAGKDHIKIVLSEDVTFLNKASVQRTLCQIPNGTIVEIDASATHFIHFDVIEIIEDFQVSAKTRDIKVSLIDLYKGKQQEPIQHFELADEKD